MLFFSSGWIKERCTVGFLSDEDHIQKNSGSVHQSGNPQCGLTDLHKFQSVAANEVGIIQDHVIVRMSLVDEWSIQEAVAVGQIEYEPFKFSRISRSITRNPGRPGNTVSDTNPPKYHFDVPGKTSRFRYSNRKNIMFIRENVSFDTEPRSLNLRDRGYQP